MLTLISHALSLLLWITTLLISPTIAFPTSFPPDYYTLRNVVSPDQVASFGPTVPWIKSLYSPSIILCQDPSFQGRCTLFANNARGACLNVMWQDPSNGGWNFALDIKSLKIGDGAACALYEGTACGGKHTTFNTSISHAQTPELTHPVVSFFCEPLDTFSTADAAQPGDTSNGKLALFDPISIPPSPHPRRKRHPKPSADSPPQPYPDPQAGNSGPSLTPWKPSSDDLPHKTTDPNCGDGPNNANGKNEDGCINPGRGRPQVMGIGDD